MEKRIPLESTDNQFHLTQLCALMLTALSKSEKLATNPPTIGKIRVRGIMRKNKKIEHLIIQLNSVML
ncbi:MULTISPECIES: hypothetical protein [Ochrobactrum]|uniref:Uncharacterized protein n=1 Tax=Ochrobactrum chromiisoli TaxID=2993941 RepID=A0ABT3QRL4_9HYPH|nr:hypothetical protein [Ochrobactrum chromiisoli]MCX2698258.1 hypothetical protein [Ochrobactrum chromiisoli]